MKSNSRDADDAVHEQHGRSLLGSRIVVEHAKGPRGPDSSGRFVLQDKLYIFSITGYGASQKHVFFSKKNKYNPPRIIHTLLLQTQSQPVVH